MKRPAVLGHHMNDPRPDWRDIAAGLTSIPEAYTRIIGVNSVPGPVPHPAFLAVARAQHAGKAPQVGIMLGINISPEGDVRELFLKELSRLNGCQAYFFMFLLKWIVAHNAPISFSCHFNSWLRRFTTRGCVISVINTKPFQRGDPSASSLGQDFACPAKPEPFSWYNQANAPCNDTTRCHGCSRGDGWRVPKKSVLPVCCLSSSAPCKWCWRIFYQNERTRSVRHIRKKQEFEQPTSPRLRRPGKLAKTAKIKTIWRHFLFGSTRSKNPSMVLLPIKKTVWRFDGWGTHQTLNR